jgi:DNA-binding IclR family transcriptional regulator
MPHYDNQATKKALYLLEAVCDSQGPVGLTELASRLELSRTTAFRHLKVLERNGFVLQMADRRYLPGFMVFRLGRRERQWRTNRYLATPLIRRLAHETGMTVHLGALEGSQVIYLMKISPTEDYAVFTREGMRLDAHATALGKAMHAFQNEDDVRAIYRYRRLERYTQNTITTIEALLGELRQIRKTGFAIERGESVPGLVCVAVPIVNTLGTSNMALSVSAPASRLTEHKIGWLGKRLRAEVHDFTDSVVQRLFS